MLAILLFTAVTSGAAAQGCSFPPPLAAYAHNDYLNPRPLQDALALGYQGVEADYVYVRGRLLVAHGSQEARMSRTLEALYLAPLRDRVRRCGSVQAPGQPFLLNIEAKEKSEDGYRALRALLRSYSDLLGTRAQPGPVQVVLVGWHPPLAFAADSGLPVKVQARLNRSGLKLPDGDPALVGMVSLDYGKTMRWRGSGELSREDRRTLDQIHQVRRRLPGRIVRAYDVPPDSAVYRMLWKSGVDLIGIKNLRETARPITRPDY